VNANEKGHRAAVTFREGGSANKRNVQKTWVKAEGRNVTEFWVGLYKPRPRLSKQRNKQPQPGKKMEADLSNKG